MITKNLYFMFYLSSLLCQKFSETLERKHLEMDDLLFVTYFFIRIAEIISAILANPILTKLIEKMIESFEELD